MKKADYIVVGSGPGGAIASFRLAQAGKKVLLLEAGAGFEAPRKVGFNLTEIEGKYKSRGVTFSLGNPKIAYIEGSVLGGGSEVNSGLYHRLAPKVAEEWERDFKIKDFKYDDLVRQFERVEKELSVSVLPDEYCPPSSHLLAKGAERMGWTAKKIPRWFKTRPDSSASDVRHSMSATYLKWAKDLGVEIKTGRSVFRIRRVAGNWELMVRGPSKQETYLTRNLVLSCGSISTAHLLRASGNREAGRSLKMQPMLKAVAEFEEDVNTADLDVPVHQVDEFSPQMTFGCSIGSIGFLGVNLRSYSIGLSSLKSSWKKYASYYVGILPEAIGSVGTIPGFQSPLVRYGFSGRDWKNLLLGGQRLASILFEAGARKIYPVGDYSEPLKRDSVLSTKLIQRAQITSVHLLATCPMGEVSRAVVDSFGRFHSMPSLLVVDGSVLPSAPGINPQGTIMAFAHRIMDQHLKSES